MSFLRLNKERTQIEGVVEIGFGNTLVTSDMKKYRECAVDNPPYVDFILRPRPTCVAPVDWDALLADTPFSKEDGTMELRDHQVEGIEHIITALNGSALVAPDPGMGKTIMAILLAKYYGGRCLFIVPTSLGPQWVAQITHILGAKPFHYKDTKKPIDPEQSIVVTSFGIVRNGLGQFAKDGWNFVCVDESENIKRESQQGKAVCQIVAAAEARILLSGTPQSCSPVDLFNQLHCLYPRVFTNRRVFEQRYTHGSYDRFNKWTPTGSVETLIDELHLLLRSVMYRVTDERQKNLPPKRRHIQPMVCTGQNKADLAKLQSERTALRAAISKASSEAQKSRLEIELRTCCNAIRHTAGRIKSKICGPWVRSLIEANGAHEKYVFFVDHVDTITNLSVVLDELELPYAVICGSVSPEQRADYVSRIADRDDPLRILIASYKTCSTGITLCPGARFVVFVELAYTPTVMQQAEKRVNREGAVEEAMLYWMTLAGSTDDRLMCTLQRRFRDNAGVVDGLADRKFTFETLPVFTEDAASAPMRIEAPQVKRLFMSEGDEHAGAAIAEGRGMKPHRRSVFACE